MEAIRCWAGRDGGYNSFVSYNELQPSWNAFQFYHNAFFILVAFVALDSEQLGEVVGDGYHYDFGVNMSPHFKGNKMSKPD